MRRLRRRAAAWAAVIGLTGTALALSVPPTAGVEGTGPAAAASPPPAEGPPSALADLDQASYELTLITGDRVRMERAGPGDYTVDTMPAVRPDGSVPDIQVTNQGEADALYVIPEDALAHLQSGLLDPVLFDVAYLAANGYADRPGLPLIVEYAGALSAATLADRAAALPAVATSTPLDSIDATAVTVDPAATADFWAGVAGSRNRVAAGIERIWLDPKVTVTLDESVPQIGADEARAAGLDGTGVTVAVLDTGIDPTHPDVAGQIVASRSFIPGEEVTDGHGHGTHVASTVAGTGAASDSRYTGVAPGADLVIGKVLSDAGSSVGSSVIAGMEWAAGELDADIVSMSLGAGPTDGTDPLSQAVNALAEQTGALFVIAAGNAGRDYSVASPGTADAALTVGAVDGDDRLASFSSRGPRRGDYAIKPEIAAPGVAIDAARATGTGTPGDEPYVRMSGTSMATPHVAGAAAILAQQQPEWTAQQLKAALVAGAEDAGLTAYEQGAGRLDVVRAIGQAIQVSPATADFGFLRLPAEGDPQTHTLTYTNPTEEPVTLELTATARSKDGTAVPPDALSLDHDTITLAAGGSATVTVTFDQHAVEPAEYTGSVVATAPGVRLTTPLGLVLGAQLHSVVVRQLHSENPDGWTPSNVSLAPIDGPADSSARGGWVTRGGGADVLSAREWAEGVEFLVPTGTYFAFTNVLARWYDPETGGEHGATLMDAEVEITGDTELVLDAADAVEVTFDTPLPSEGFQRRYLLQRWDPEHVAAGGGFITLGANPTSTDGRGGGYWVTPTEKVSTGQLRLVAEHTLVAPTLSMQVDGHDDLSLHPQYLEWGSPFASISGPTLTIGGATIGGAPATTAPGPVVQAGADVEVAVQVTNPPGSTPKSDLRVTSPAGVGSCELTALPSGGSTICTVRGPATEGRQAVPITVIGTADGWLDDGPVDSVTATVAYYTGATDPTSPPPESGAALTIAAATVSGQSARTAPGPDVEVGSEIVVEVVALNSGTTTLANVAASSGLGELACLKTTLAPGERTSCALRTEATEGRQAYAVVATGGDADGSHAGAAAVVTFVGQVKPAVFEGSSVHRVVDAGFGTAEELSGLDLRDALVMVRADPAEMGSRPVACWPERSVIEAVVAAGAGGVIVAPNEETLFHDRPASYLHGSLQCEVAPLLSSTDAHPFQTAAHRAPIVFLPHDQGAALRDLAAGGDLQVAVDATAVTPYVYQLQPAIDTAVPESLHFTVDPDAMVTIDHEVHASAASAFGLTLATWQATDAAVGPRTTGTRALPPFATTAPWNVTEYYWPLDPDTVVRHEMDNPASPAGRQVRYDVFDEPAHVTMVWNDSPPVPVPVPALAGSAPVGYQTHGHLPVEQATCVGCREGDVFVPHLRYSASSDPGQVGWDIVGHLGQLGNDSDTRLYRNGVEVPGGPDPVSHTLLAFELPPERAEYRLTHRLGHTETAWEFTSETVVDDQLADPYICDSEWMERLLKRPPSGTPCRPEPLIFLRYDLGLDLSNRADAPGPQTIEVSTDRQPSRQPMPDVAGLRLWVSYDEGTEWTEARVRPRGDGSFEATVLHRPANRRASDVVSLRVEAWDDAGNRVEQTIRNAYRLSERTEAGDPR